MAVGSFFPLQPRLPKTAQNFIFVLIILYVHCTTISGRISATNTYYVSFFLTLSKNMRPTARTLQIDMQMCHTYKLLPHCNPVQGQYRARTGFSLCTFPTQGKTCFHYRVPRWLEQVFPCWEKYTGKPLFSLQGWVCSATKLCKGSNKFMLMQAAWDWKKNYYFCWLQ